MYYTGVEFMDFLHDDFNVLTFVFFFELLPTMTFHRFDITATAFQRISTTGMHKFSCTVPEVPFTRFTQNARFTRENETISLASEMSIKVIRRSPGHENDLERNEMILTF